MFSVSNIPYIFTTQKTKSEQYKRNTANFRQQINSPYFFNLLNNNKMKTGKVKFFDETKGFGFIIDEETGTDYFVHVSGLIDKITEDDKVTFELTEGKKGLNAVNVKLA